MATAEQREQQEDRDAFAYGQAKQAVMAQLHDEWMAEFGVSKKFPYNPNGAIVHALVLKRLKESKEHED